MLLSSWLQWAFWQRAGWFSDCQLFWVPGRRPMSGAEIYASLGVEVLSLLATPEGQKKKKVVFQSFRRHQGEK